MSQVKSSDGESNDSVQSIIHKLCHYTLTYLKSKCFQARNPSSVISLNRSLSSIVIFDSVWPDTLDAILPAVDAGESTYSGLWCYQHRRKRPDRLDNQVKDCLFVSAIVAGRITYCYADCTISIMSICRIKYDHSLCVIETKQTEERFMDNWD
ncbi:unnamed protein product [Albugo candida]|uniref:Uncharacterized protein n=1 Tax=Albugo candida TaxID=65357 RepID=A0A024GSV7_9STRA|nr:unnamed protein product [Albugo candida]|eukprot:CCI49873.1 unnamed protein product [Albugo candida]